jgi:hypothetical protein
VIFRKASRERRASGAAACEDIIVCRARSFPSQMLFLWPAQPSTTSSRPAVRKRSAVDVDVGQCFLGP